MGNQSEECGDWEILTGPVPFVRSSTTHVNPIWESRAGSDFPPGPDRESPAAGPNPAENEASPP